MAVKNEVANVVTFLRALTITLTLAAAPACAELRVVVISGLGGEPEFEQRFLQQAESVAQAAARAGAPKDEVLVLSGARARRTLLDRELKTFAARVRKEDQIAVFLIGHGAYDGEEYRLNLPGPDLTGRDIGAWLDSLTAGQVLVMNATSASGAALDSWKRPNRIVITATKSGNERTATRFGDYWAQALTSTEADRDKNEVITAAEAFDFASRKVADAFKVDATLATEHARLDGKNANTFVVARLGGAVAVPNDPELNAMLTEQLGLEQRIDQIKARKDGLNEQQYYDELEQVLIELAKLDRRIEQRKISPGQHDASGT